MNKDSKDMVSAVKAEYSTGPVRLLLIISLSIFLAEAFVMYVLSFFPPMSDLLEMLVDSVMLVLLVSPFLYIFLFMPLVKNIAEKKKSEESEKEKSAELKILVEELNSYADTLRLDVKSAKQILNFISGKKVDQIEVDKDCSLAITSVSMPCSTEGGDHFFIKNISGLNGNKGVSTVISLKDQSGHSVPCLMRSISTDMIHNSLLDARVKKGFAELLKELNDTIIGSGLFNDGEYFTSLDCHFNHETMIMEYASSGHPPMMHVRGGQVAQLPQYKSSGHNLPMVLFNDDNVTIDEIKLEVGDKLILYTDGLYELLINNGRGFSIEDLRGMIAQYAQLPVSEIIENVISEIALMSGETIDPHMEMNSTDDDITVLGIELVGLKENLITA